MSSTVANANNEIDSFASTAAAFSTPQLEGAIERLQEMLSEREIQSYIFAPNKFDDLVGLDKTKIKLVPLKKPSQKYGRFVQRVGKIYADKTKSWMFHVGNGAFEMQYAWVERVISGGAEKGQRSVFAFGPALLSAGFPEHVPDFSIEMQTGFGKLAEQLSKDCGDVAPWEWNIKKALQLVCWAVELIGETDANLSAAVYNIQQGGCEVESEEDSDGGHEEEEDTDSDGGDEEEEDTDSMDDDEE